MRVICPSSPERRSCSSGVRVIDESRSKGRDPVGGGDRVVGCDRTRRLEVARCCCGCGSRVRHLRQRDRGDAIDAERVAGHEVGGVSDRSSGVGQSRVIALYDLAGRRISRGGDVEGRRSSRIGDRAQGLRMSGGSARVRQTGIVAGTHRARGGPHGLRRGVSEAEGVSSVTRGCVSCEAGDVPQRVDRDSAREAHGCQPGGRHRLVSDGSA